MEQPWNGVILQCTGLAGGQGGLSEPQQVDREDYQSRDKHSGQADTVAREDSAVVWIHRTLWLPSTCSQRRGPCGS